MEEPETEGGWTGDRYANQADALREACRKMGPADLRATAELLHDRVRAMQRQAEDVYAQYEAAAGEEQKEDQFLLWRRCLATVEYYRTLYGAVQDAAHDLLNRLVGGNPPGLVDRWDGTPLVDPTPRQEAMQRRRAAVLRRLEESPAYWARMPEDVKAELADEYAKGDTKVIESDLAFLRKTRRSPSGE